MEQWTTLHKDMINGIQTKSVKAVIHMARSKTLANRVTTVFKTIETIKSGLALDSIRIKSCFSMLSATLEEIAAYLDLLQKRDATLGKRVSQYGDDEECFCNWNETLQTCCEELRLAVPTDFFDAAADERDFNSDMKHLHHNLKEILAQYVNMLISPEKVVEANEKLLDQQLSGRSQSKTQKNVIAEKSFDNKKIVWEASIGRGGKNCVLIPRIW